MQVTSISELQKSPAEDMFCSSKLVNFISLTKTFSKRARQQQKLAHEVPHRRVVKISFGSFRQKLLECRFIGSIGVSKVVLKCSTPLWSVPFQHPLVLLWLFSIFCRSSFMSYPELDSMGLFAWCSRSDQRIGKYKLFPDKKKYFPCKCSNSRYSGCDSCPMYILNVSIQ